MFNVIVLKNKSNTLLLTYNKKGLLLDTGYDREDTEKIIKFLNDNGVILDNVIISHFHRDHIQGIDLLNYTFPNVKFYASNITKFVFENTWVEENLYDDCVNNCMKSGQTNSIKINMIEENFDFYGKKIKVFNANGHCYGNLIFMIDNYMFCPDIIVNSEEYLPFISDVESYLSDIDRLTIINNIDYVILTHKKEILNHGQFLEELARTKEKIMNKINDILDLINDDISFDTLINEMIKNGLRTACFTKKMNEEQYGYTHFVTRNILRYLEINEKITIEYKDKKIYLNRRKY